MKTWQIIVIIVALLISLIFNGYQLAKKCPETSPYPVFDIVKDTVYAESPELVRLKTEIQKLKLKLENLKNEKTIVIDSGYIPASFREFAKSYEL